MGLWEQEMKSRVSENARKIWVDEKRSQEGMNSAS